MVNTTKRVIALFLTILLLFGASGSVFAEEGAALTESEWVKSDVEAPDIENDGTDPDVAAIVDEAAEGIKDAIEELAETAVSEIAVDGGASEDIGLWVISGGSLVPYNPNSASGTRATPSGIYYSDIFGAHSSDLNGVYLKAGGNWSNTSGHVSWYPYSTGSVAETGYRVISSNLYCNSGPSYYKSENNDSLLAVPIRPSQESGHNGTSYETSKLVQGVPDYLSESLYSQMIPAYTSATWNQIGLVYSVAKGMGGMTASGSAEITAAASTLINNIVFGYIGLGSDSAFYGTPLMTSSSSTNQQMANILAWCEVYAKEEGMTGSVSGDNTLQKLAGKGFSAPDTSGWWVKSGSIGTVYSRQFYNTSSSGNQIYVYTTSEIYFENNKFDDIRSGTWYYDAVIWAVKNGVTEGTSATTFSPNADCTRAQVVTLLWRADGSPEPETMSNPFQDIKSDAYYDKAVLWAAENNITAGTSATTFSPDAICTRAQIVTLLWRFHGSPETSGTNPFEDVKTGSFYEKAVLWAAEAGVTTGTSGTTFSPENICTRAQVVVFLYRDIEETKHYGHYDIQQAIDGANKYLASLGYTQNYNATPSNAGYFPPMAILGETISALGGQTWLNNRAIEKCSSSMELGISVLTCYGFYKPETDEYWIYILEG